MAQRVASPHQRTPSNLQPERQSDHNSMAGTFGGLFDLARN